MQLKIIQLKQVVLLIIDLIILYASLFLTLLLRYQTELTYDIWWAHLTSFTVIYIIWVIIFYINGLYDVSIAQNTSSFWHTFFGSLGINTLLAVAIFYLNPSLGIAPKTNLFLNIGVFALLFFIWRNLYNHFISSSILKNRVLIIGKMLETAEIARIIKERPQLGYKIVACVDINKNTDKVFECHLLNKYPSYSICDIKNLFSQRKIDTVIIPPNLKESEELIRSLYSCIFHKISFVDLVDFYEKLTGKIPVSAVTEYWFLQNLHEGEKKFYDLVKIVFDYGLAMMLGFFTLVVFPFIAAAIKFNDNGPIFYKQKRTGKFGEIFEIIKFRTMKVGADKDGAKFAAFGDDRITGVGNFLRATRIDEFPQVLNILRGEMSFLGPRPEQPEFVEKLQQKMPFYALRHLIKPGLTGWAQINYQYASSIEENLKKLQYDLFYIKNRSVLMDFMILLKTINTLIRRKGV